jgi:endonuclease/exonuclease/phosphatase family metal-dependent hydrolase
MTAGRRIAGLAAALLVATTLAVAVPAGADSSVRLKVMTFNIFYGGDEIDLDQNHWCVDAAGCPETMDQVIAAIRRSDADIIGMQEGTANGCVIADRLGWYCSERLQVISRYRLIDPPGANGVYVYAQIEPGRVVAVANVHLPAEPYGPYYPREGWTLEQILELERTTRLPWVRPHLRTLPDLAAAGIPTFMTGDFNSPSHLDWTEEVAEVRPDVVLYPVEWPVAKALADAGMRDSYREIHPDPVAKPGFTWTPGSLEEIADEVHDRIDWVLASGPATTLSSRIVGEPGNPDTDIVVDPYPTDHRGVVSTFRVIPGTPEPFAAVDHRRVFVGDRLLVRFRAEGGPDEAIAIVPAGAGLGKTVASRSTDTEVAGAVRFATDSFGPRDYEAVLVHDDDVLSRSPFWLYEPGTPPQVWTNRRIYERGEPIRVSWAAAPGYKWDWVGVYKPGDGPTVKADECNAGYCGNGHYLLYEYTGASIEGSTRFDAYSSPGYATWPLKRGWYEIRLLMDDGYRLLGISLPFKVVAVR